MKYCITKDRVCEFATISGYCHITACIKETTVDGDAMSTREEAKKYLIDLSYKLGTTAVEELTLEDGEKMRKAVEDVEQSPSEESEPAQWIQMLINPNMYKCSNCQVAWNRRLVFDNEGYSKNIFMKYCPCCGKKMLEKVDCE